MTNSWNGLSTLPLTINQTPSTSGINISKVIIYNHILNTNEIRDNYIQFLNSKPINKPTVFQPNLNILKPSEVRE